MKGLYYIVAFAALTLLAGCGKSGPAVDFDRSITSPDGTLTVSFGVTADGTPCYKLERNGKEVVKASRLGFELTDGSSLHDGFSVTAVDYDSKDETWEPVWGEERSIRNHYNEMTVTLEQMPEGVKAPQSGVSVTDPDYTGTAGTSYTITQH